MAGKRSIPGYKSPLSAKLTRSQKIAALKGRMRTVEGLEKRKAGVTGPKGWQLGRFAGENRNIMKRSLYKWLTETKFEENQIVAEKLARILDAAEHQHIEPTDGHMATILNAYKRLRQAERSTKKVALAPNQVEIVEKYFAMV